MLPALRSAGLPTGRKATQALAAALYSSVLYLLPASARTWFGDLRDRGAAAAVEAYTAAVESPALVAAEIAAIQVRSSLACVRCVMCGRGQAREEDAPVLLSLALR